MKNFLSHYTAMKCLLQNEDGLDKDALREKYEIAVEDAQADTNLYDFNDTDRDVILALMHRIERMHSLGHHDYVRDDISQLSFYPEGHVSVTFNSHWNQKSEKELYQPIHNYFCNMLNKGGNFGPQDEPFYSGEIFHRVTEEQMQEFVQTLTNATHQIADHIVENVSNNWHGNQIFMRIHSILLKSSLTLLITWWLTKNVNWILNLMFYTNVLFLIYLLMWSEECMLRRINSMTS